MLTSSRLASPARALAEEGDQPAFGARQIFRWARTMQGQPFPGRLLHGFDDRRVHIGFAADRGRIAQHVGDLLEHRLQADALLAGGADLREGEHARAPGPEMLGGEILARGLANVIVDVGGGDRVRLAVVVQILEQVLAGQVLALLHDPAERRVGDPELPLDAAFRLEAHLHGPAGHFRMAAAERGGAIALVRLRVSLVADADAAAVEQPDDRGDDGVPGEAALPEVRLDPPPELRQHLAEVAAALELRRLLPLPEPGVIAILLPAPVVIADRLDVPVGIGAEPGLA